MKKILAITAALVAIASLRRARQSLWGSFLPYHLKLRCKMSLGGTGRIIAVLIYVTPRIEVAPGLYYGCRPGWYCFGLPYRASYARA